MTDIYRLKQVATRYLEKHENLESVTIRRKRKRKRITFKDARSECHALMPESCPIVGAVLAETLPDGVAVDEDKRGEVLNRLHDRVTSPFRDALLTACDQKHAAIRELKALRRRLDELLENIESDIPEEMRERIENKQNPSLDIQIDEDEPDEDDEDGEVFEAAPIFGRQGRRRGLA
jgi:hypothetical protein